MIAECGFRIADLGRHGAKGRKKKSEVGGRRKASYRFTLCV
jgi:hypothetical protein